MAASDPAIRTHGLTRHFGALVAVNHIDLDVPAAVIIGGGAFQRRDITA